MLSVAHFSVVEYVLVNRALVDIAGTLKKSFDFGWFIAQAHICRIFVGETMNKLVCDECGTIFNCGTPPGTLRCWCMDVPNLRGSFDLAGSCVCPDCLTLGKSKSITKMRKIKKKQRDAAKLRTKA